MRITATLTRHLAGAAIEALVVALLIAIALLALSPVSPKAGELAGLSDAQARGKSSITVPDGVFGQAVMATVNPGGSGVWAYAACFQDGQTVWAQYVRPDAENHAVFGLGPSERWTGGDADCVAEEGSFGRSGKWRAMAKTTFSATDPS